MHLDPVVALAGLVVGLAVGMTGMGGGSLMTPILVLLFGIPPIAAVSSDLVASLVMKPVGALVHLQRRTVHWRLVGWLAVGSIPCAAAGAVTIHSLGTGSPIQNAVQLTLGAVLLTCVIAVAVRTGLEFRRRREVVVESAAARVRRFEPLTLVVVGAVVGFVLGVTSTGSGTLVIVCLLFLYPRLRGSEMVGTDMVQAIPMVGAAALAHIVLGDFRLGLTTSILIGSIPGVLVGALFSSRAGTEFIRAALSVVLLASGLKLVNVPTATLAVAVCIGAALALTLAVLRTRDRQASLAGAP